MYLIHLLILFNRTSIIYVNKGLPGMSNVSHVASQLELFSYLSAFNLDSTYTYYPVSVTVAVTVPYNTITT